MGLLLRAPLGTFIGSGGGLSLYEPEPAYQQGVQSTGSRTTPDVSLRGRSRPPGPGSPTRTTCRPSNPFEVVGGTSLSAPAWAGLLALANQGRVAAGATDPEQLQPDRDPASPLQPAPERLQRHHQRHQRLHRERRLQPGDRPGDARGQPPDSRPGRLPGTRFAGLPRARRSAPCRMPTSSPPGRVPGVRSMCSASSIPSRSRATAAVPAPT